MLWDTVERTSNLAVDRYLFLADCWREELHELEKEGFFPARWKLKIQQGEGLGDRLLNAHRLLCRSHSRVAFLGSDSPTVPLDWVEQAFQKLRESPVVIGPTSDGGYYLLGLAEGRPQIFEGIDWGTRRVLRQTREKLLPEDFQLLPVWYDVDEAADLSRLQTDLKSWHPDQPGFPRRTAQFVNELSSGLQP